MRKNCRSLIHRLLLHVCFFAGSVSVVCAQDINLDEYKAKYPGESKVCLSHKNDIVIELEDKQLQVRMKEHEESLCLDKNAMLHAEESVFCSGTYLLESLVAKTITSKEQGCKTIKVKKFDTVDYRSPSVFYDDKKSIEFNFPKLEEGSRTFLEYTYKITEPKLLSGFYFESGLYTENAELTVTFPKTVQIGYRMFNCDSLPIEFSEKKSGSKITYSWKVKNIHKLNYEEQAPSFSYFAAHIFVYIKSYNLKDQEIKVLSDVGDLFKWYQSLIGQVNTKPSKSLKAFADSLTNGLTTEFEKVKCIYYWVQDHIKYIAFEGGRDGYVPRDAELVYGRRYGDCKDMASLINKMLQEIGIKSYLTWIGTRYLPYKYEDIPLASVDDHMIVTYIKDGQCYFLDGTAGQLTIVLPPHWIQGKEALFGTDNGQYKIVKVPEIAQELNQTIDTIKVKLEGRKLKGSSITYFKGCSRVDMHDDLVNKDKEAQTTFLKNYFEKGNNKFLIDDFELKNFEKRDNDLIIGYDFNVDDYAQTSGNEIFVNLNMDKVNLGETIKDTRKVPLERDYRKIITNNLILEIPQGYQLSYLPKNTEFKNDQFGYSVTYKSDPTHVILTHQLYLNYLQLQPSSFKEWNNLINALNSTYRSSIILKKN